MTIVNPGDTEHSAARGGELYDPAQFVDVYGVPGRIGVLPYSQLVILRQTRRGKNPVLDELTDSISRRKASKPNEQSGLLEPPIVTKMTREQLEWHVVQLSQLWQEPISIEEYEHLVQPDRLYYVVTDGHTRMMGIGYDITKRGLDPEQIGVAAMVVDFDSTASFFSDQQEANIHSRTTPEEEMFVLVRLYEEGVESESWSGPEEFRSQQKKRWRKQRIDQIIAFAELPPLARDFVYDKRVWLTAAIKLGEVMPRLREYYFTRLKVDQESFDRKIITMLMKMSSVSVKNPRTGEMVPGPRMSVKDCAAYIDSVVASLSGQAETSLFTPEDIAAMEAQRIRNEFDQEVGFLTSGIRTAPERVLKVLDLVQKHTGDDVLSEAEKAVRALQEGAGRAVRQLTLSS